MIFFPLGMFLKQMSLEAASWPNFIVLKKQGDHLIPRREGIAM
jgi:hypothetical protein